VLGDKVVQSHNELSCMMHIMPLQGDAYVIDDHLANLISSMGLTQQTLCQGGGRHGVNVFVFGNCRNFVFVEA